MLLAAMLPALTACSGVPPAGSRAAASAPSPGTSFDPGQLAKTDIDRVADIHRQEVFTSLRVLAEKLYRRNPGEWRKSGAVDMNAAMERLMAAEHGWRFVEPDGRHGTEAMALAFRDDYRGDRVLALIGGLGGMMQAAFNDKTEFFMLDDLDPQKLYNSARNVEIAVWRLSNARMADGGPFLLSNEAAKPGQPPNLSFEREFGKIIGHFDLLSRIVADKSNRTIVKVIQSLASAAFLPVVVVK